MDGEESGNATEARSTIRETHSPVKFFWAFFALYIYIQDTCPNNQGSISGECTRIVSEGGGYHANHLFSTETLNNSDCSIPLLFVKERQNFPPN